MTRAQLTLADGRSIGIDFAGTEDGAPVFVFHGLPGSRLQRHPDDALTRAAQVRTIHLDRPGFGLSSRQPRRRLIDWPNDVREIADALGIAGFAVVGISGGGPYALACAARLGGRVTRAAIASGVGDRRLSADRSQVHLVIRAGFSLAARAPWLLRPQIAMARQLALRAPRRYLRIARLAAPADDRAKLDEPSIEAMFIRDMAESFRQDSRAFVDDLGLLGRAWGFEPADIRVPVRFWHGDADRVVAIDEARVLAARMPSASARWVAGAGHLGVFDWWADILRWLTEDVPAHTVGR